MSLSMVNSQCDSVSMSVIRGRSIVIAKSSASYCVIDPGTIFCDRNLLYLASVPETTPPRRSSLLTSRIGLRLLRVADKFLLKALQELRGCCCCFWERSATSTSYQKSKNSLAVPLRYGCDGVVKAIEAAQSPKYNFILVN